MDQNEKKGIDSWGLLLKAQSQITQEIDWRLKADGRISLVWYDILLVIHSSKAKALRMSEVVEKVVLTKSGVSRAVEGMVKAGLIDKTSAKEDGRGYKLSLTRDGRKEFAKVWRIYRQAIQDLFHSKLSAKDVENIYRALSKVVI